MTCPRDQGELQARARQSLGISNSAIYLMVAGVLVSHDIRGKLFIDVGCGSGRLRPLVCSRFSHYVGVDLIRYEGFPADAGFLQCELERDGLPFPDLTADVVAAVETIEHLENPRAFVRELVRVLKPGGWVIITTPNQLSILSLATLVVKHRFAAFQDIHYPAHLTALLEVDLRRMASECGLAGIEITYSHEGRVAFMAWHYPRFLSALFPRALSDNVLLVARKPSQ